MSSRMGWLPSAGENPAIARHAIAQEATLKLASASTGEVVGQTDEQALVLVDDKFKFTPTGLLIVGEPSFQEWEEVGLILSHIQKRVHFWIGDWLNYGERRWGEKYAQVLDATNFSYQTLANDKWVTGKVEPSRRRENVSFSHHAEVAGLTPKEQDKWLEKAEGEGLTTNQLRRQIRAAKALPNPGGDEGDEPETTELTIQVVFKVPVDGKDAVRQSAERWALRMAEFGAKCEALNVWED